MARSTLLNELEAAGAGTSQLASLCAEAADRIRRQDERIVMLKKQMGKLKGKVRKAQGKSATPVT